MRPRTKKHEIGELSRAVKKLREALGQTQQQFAQSLGTAITTIARYETGRAPHGRSLAMLAQVAAQNDLPELANKFRIALTKELGTLESSGMNLALEPRDETERLYLSAVLAILRNEQYSRLIPELNHVLRGPAKISIEILESAKKRRAAKGTALRMWKDDRPPEDIAAALEVPLKEVQLFIEWMKFEEQLNAAFAEHAKAGIGN